MPMKRRARPASPLPAAGAESARRRLLGWACVLALLLLVAAMLTWSPVGQQLDPQALGERLARFRAEPWAPPLVLAAFVAATLLMLPITLMVVLTAVAFGPWLGYIVALIATIVSGAAGFAVGRVLGHRHVARLAGGPVDRLSRRIARHGVVTIMLLRMVPMAHFTVVSLAAGTSHMRLRSFLAGTLLGMAPGMAVLIFFIDRLTVAALRPDPVQMAIALGLGAALLAALLGLRHWLRRRRARRAGGHRHETANSVTR